VTVAVSPSLERAAAWRLLALALVPTEESLAAARLLADALADGDDTLAQAQDLAGALATADPAAVAADAFRLFGGAVRVSPYEGSYEADPFRQARQLADVSGFYRAFGAAAHGPAAERADHAGAELEFLAFLGARRLAAVDDGREDEAQLLREIEDAFLVDHAGRWLPEFFRELAAEEEAGPVFSALARLGEALVVDELARRGLEPAPLGPKRTRLSVEADSFECAAAGQMTAPLVPEPDVPMPRRDRRRR
jgi:TorA maturation chaperone TorD